MEFPSPRREKNSKLPFLFTYDSTQKNIYQSIIYFLYVKITPSLLEIPQDLTGGGGR